MQNRVPYRRVTPAKNRPTMYEAPPSVEPGLALTFRDNLIIQLAISGVLMMALVVIALANTTHTTRIREELQTALAGATTPGELMEDIRAFMAPQPLGEEPPIPEVFEAVEPVELPQNRMPAVFFGE